MTSSTLHELLERNHVSQLDVFQVDAEGSDARILLSLDLERHVDRPHPLCFLEFLPIFPADMHLAALFVVCVQVSAANKP